MASYKTEQKRLLTEFLNNNSEKSFTIEEIVREISKSEGSSAPGLSTVYRLIPKLIEEGKVRRFSGEGRRKFLYQAISGKECSRHLHLKCTECGKLFHVNNLVSEEVKREILSSSNFTVDSARTLLVGQCKECRGEGI